jgi:hypothetical protein
MDAAIGYVMAQGDAVDRARLAWLRAGSPPPEHILASVEVGAAPGGGWPPLAGAEAASIDATCFRLSELDDLAGLGRPPARRALDWLAVRQRSDGTWEEDQSLAEVAPPWATPGDPEARFYLTANVAFWITAGGLDARAAGPRDHRVGGAYAGVLHGAAKALAEGIRADGTWPSYLAAGWLAGAVLYRQRMLDEYGRIESVLVDRLATISPSDVASLAVALRRVDVGHDNDLLAAACRRLSDTQRSDGGWDSDDGLAFDVHTTLKVIRACR